jgi:uncharacterized DUF497 family protein
LAAHEVTPAEFEQVFNEFEPVFNNDPLDLNYELIDNEERYCSVGVTSGGRLLSVVFAVRNGRLRAATFSAQFGWWNERLKSDAAFDGTHASLPCQYHGHARHSGR